MDTSKRREIRARYKQADEKATGCIYEIRCTVNGRCWVSFDPSLHGAQSRYEFSQKIGGCPLPSMLADWKQYGKEAFTFSVLETMDKKETQTTREFREDLETLEELWLEKYDASTLYSR